MTAPRTTIDAVLKRWRLRLEMLGAFISNQRSRMGRIALAVTMLTSLAGCHVTTERIVVNENYRGPVVIVFGDPSGVEPSVENGLFSSTRTFQIPQTGILHVRSDKPVQWRVTAFVGDVEIPVSDVPETKRESRVLQAYFYESPVIGSTPEEPSVQFHSLIIGIPATDPIRELRARRDEMIGRAVAEASARIKQAE